MSCRETPGNSAVTSFARFRTGLGETVVSREFHAARRAAARRLGEDAKRPEPAGNVERFLTGMRREVEADTSLTARNKASLLRRIGEAEGNVRAGVKSPNRATFAAWVELPNYLAGYSAARRKAENGAGTLVTAEDVAAAAAELQHAKDLLVAERQSTSQQARIGKVAEAQERYRRVQAAYDTTPKGFAELRHQFRVTGATDSAVAERWAAANTRLDAPRRRRRAAGSDLAGLAREAQAARGEAAHAAAMWRLNPGKDSGEAARRAAEKADAARAAYLDSVADSVPLPPLGDGAQFSVQAWAATAHPTLSRGVLWAAAEHRLRQVDAGAAADGKFGRADVARRAARRAAARDAAMEYSPPGGSPGVSRQPKEVDR